MLKKILLFFSISLVVCFSSISLAIQKDIDQNQNKKLDELDQRVEKLETATLEKQFQDGHLVNRWKGFNLFFGMTGILQGDLNNNKNVSNGDVLSVTGSMDIIVSRVFFEHGAALAHFISGNGNGLNSTPVLNSLLFGVVNYDAYSHSSMLEFAEGYYQGFYFDKKFEFILGRIDPTIMIDLNAVADDETSQFLNGGFRNNTTIDFPSYTFGGRISIKPYDWIYLNAMLASAATDGYQIEKKMFFAGELGITPKVNGMQGNYRFDVWSNHRNHTNAKHGWTNDYGWGVGYSFDQEITNWITLFARGGYRKKEVYQSYMVFSGGFGIYGNAYGRDNDMLGCAYGTAFNSSDFGPGNNEHVIEIFYRLMLAKDHVGISPDFQFIINPSGAKGVHNVFVGGVRAQIDI